MAQAEPRVVYKCTQGPRATEWVISEYYFLLFRTCALLPYPKIKPLALTLVVTAWPLNAEAGIRWSRDRDRPIRGLPWDFLRRK